MPAESDWQVSRLYTVFGRAEYVAKTGQELDLLPEGRKFDISQLTLGAVPCSLVPSALDSV